MLFGKCIQIALICLMCFTATAKSQTPVAGHVEWSRYEELLNGEATWLSGDNSFVTLRPHVEAYTWGVEVWIEQMRSIIIAKAKHDNFYFRMGRLEKTITPDPGDNQTQPYQLQFNRLPHANQLVISSPDGGIGPSVIPQVLSSLEGIIPLRDKCAAVILETWDCQQDWQDAICSGETTFTDDPDAAEVIAEIHAQEMRARNLIQKMKWLLREWKLSTTGIFGSNDTRFKVMLYELGEMASQYPSRAAQTQAAYEAAVADGYVEVVPVPATDPPAQLGDNYILPLNVGPEFQFPNPIPDPEDWPESQ